MTNESIAIVGLACQLPGASSAHDFWANLISGIDSISAPPVNRQSHLLEDCRGGFLDKFDYFDPSFFGISFPEARLMDPQQRLLLQVTWWALEDAGIDPRGLEGTNTAVFVGTAGCEYDHILLQHDSNPSVYAQLGAHSSIISNRLSSSLNLCGKSVSVNTACSSSLTAVEMACQELWLNNTNVAIAAGVNLLFAPHISERFQNSGWLSSTGSCRPYDAGSDGYVRSEGVGVLILKTYTQAKLDGDRIYALVKEISTNHNGKGNGLGIPSLKAQVDLLSKIYGESGISPTSVDYIETHAVGAKVGDVIELKALASVLGRKRLPDEPLMIGSIKPNIGHAEGASGIAAIIKVALACFYRTLPPTINFNSTSPAINLARMRLKVQSKSIHIRRQDGPLRCGVSSFSFGGGNTHILLEESIDTALRLPRSCPVQLIEISANSASSLQAQARELALYLSRRSTGLWAEIGFTLNVKRTRFPYRMAIIADSIEQFIRRLHSASIDMHACSSFAYHLSAQPIRYNLFFVFSSRCLLARETIEYLCCNYASFDLAFQYCEQTVRSLLNISLLDLVSTMNPVNEGIDAIRGFLSEYLLYQLWRCWDLQPALCIGTGLGLYGAAVAAGILELDDAIRQLLCPVDEFLPHPTKPATIPVYCTESEVLLCPGEVASTHFWRPVSTKSDRMVNKDQFFPYVFLGVATASISFTNEDKCVESTQVVTIELLLGALIELRKAGFEVDFNIICGYQDCRVASIACYPFDLHRFWIGDENHGPMNLPCKPSTPGQANSISVAISPFTIHLEQQLLGIWQQVLGHSNFGISDNFFLVGGSSLSASELCAKLTEVFRIDIDTTIIFHYPTIKELKQWLGTINTINDSEPSGACLTATESLGNLVVLQPHGSKIPLFAVHGYAGSLSSFIGLAKALAPRRPFWGIQADIKQSLSLNNTCVSSMAGQYADQIMKVRPNGLIHLLGYSAGGWYAHAVAAALLDRGAHIGLFGVLDSHSVARIHLRIGARLALLKAAKRFSEMDDINIPFIWERVRNSSYPKLRKRLLNAARSINGQSELLLNVRIPNPIRPPQNMDFFVKLLKRTYRPPILPIKAYLFAPSANLPTLARLWSFYCELGVQKVSIFKNHHDFYAEDLMPELAKSLEKVITSIEEREASS